MTDLAPKVHDGWGVEDINEMCEDWPEEARKGVRLAPKCGQLIQPRHQGFVV